MTTATTDPRPTTPIPPAHPDGWRSWLLSAAWGLQREAQVTLRFIDGKLPELPESARRWLHSVTLERKQGRPTMRAEWAREVLAVCGYTLYPSETTTAGLRRLGFGHRPTTYGGGGYREIFRLSDGLVVGPHTATSANEWIRSGCLIGEEAS